jgi:hypothetical protein
MSSQAPQTASAAYDGPKFKAQLDDIAAKKKGLDGYADDNDNGGLMGKGKHCENFSPDFPAGCFVFIAFASGT